MSGTVSRVRRIAPYSVIVIVLILFFVVWYGCVHPFIDRDKWFHLLFDLELPLWMLSLCCFVYMARITFKYNHSNGKPDTPTLDWVTSRILRAIFCFLVLQATVKVSEHYDYLDRNKTFQVIMAEEGIIDRIPGTPVYNMNIEVDGIDQIQGYVSIRYNSGVRALLKGRKVCAFYESGYYDKFCFDDCRNSGKSGFMEKLRPQSIEGLASTLTDDDIHMLDIMTESFSKYAEKNIPSMDVQYEYENIDWGSSKLRKACIKIMENRRITPRNL